MILRRLVSERLVVPPNPGEPFRGPIPEGAVISAYATRGQVRAAGLESAPRFIVLRDPRDTLVSAYFSFRDTHQSNEQLQPLRKRLNTLDFETGMVDLMDRFMPMVVAIHESWRGEPFVRYEDLLERDFAILRRTFAGVGLDVPDRRLRRVVVQNRFRERTGREPGVEAPEHLRKGIAGDWRNHFTERIEEEYQARFGTLDY